MRPGWFVNTQPVFFALVLHMAVLLLLLISFSYTPELQPVKQISIVNAVTVDKAKVEEEIRRLKQAEEKKHQAEKQRVEELEKKLETDKKKAEEIKNQRVEEEKQLSLTRKQKEDEQKKQEEAQKKVAELEQQRKLEEEKKAKTEAEKKKQEAELKKKEEEKKRQEAEKALQEQLEAEQTEEQKQQNATLMQKIVNEITNKVTRNFNKSGLPDNLSCRLMVKLLPTGEVASVSLIETSGNDIFDRRALLAVEKSSPFALPEEVDLEKFEQLNLRELSFKFIPPKD